MAEANIVDVEFLARFFNKDVRTIQLWSKDHGMPKEERGKYDFIKVVRWRILFLEDKIEELEKGDATLYQLKQEYQKMMNQEKALRIQKMRNELVEVALVQLAWVSQMKNISRSIDSLVSNLYRVIINAIKVMEERQHSGQRKDERLDARVRADIINELNNWRLTLSEGPLDINDEVEREIQSEFADEEEE